MALKPFDQEVALHCLVREFFSPFVQGDSVEVTPITMGASGRVIERISIEGKSYIGIAWTTARADNVAYLSAASILTQVGVNVPSLLVSKSEEDGSGVCIVQDLGSTCLLDLKSASWKTLRKAYEQAISEVITLHNRATDPNLLPPFDEKLYRWEQEYFAEQYLALHKHCHGTALMGHVAFVAMAKRLADLPRCMIHRDFQSQNIMMHDGGAWLIDFQGMRPGLPEYDAASLIFDPYMDLSYEQRLKLIDLWRTLGGKLDSEILALCAFQRIMQALGAYAKLWYREGKSWYSQWLEPGLRSLEQIADLPDAGDLAHEVSLCLRAAHVI